MTNIQSNDFNTVSDFGALTLVSVLRGDSNGFLPVGVKCQATIDGSTIFAESAVGNVQAIGTVHSATQHQINRKLQKGGDVTMTIERVSTNKIVLTCESSLSACYYNVARMSAEEIKASVEARRGY